VLYLVSIKYKCGLYQILLSRRNVLQMNLAQSPIFIQIAFAVLCIIAVGISTQTYFSVWKEFVVSVALAWLSSIMRSSGNDNAWVFPEREISGELKNESESLACPTLLY
jgi:hypothetical protein